MAPKEERQSEGKGTRSPPHVSVLQKLRETLRTLTNPPKDLNNKPEHSGMLIAMWPRLLDDLWRRHDDCYPDVSCSHAPDTEKSESTTIESPHEEENGSHNAEPRLAELQQLYSGNHPTYDIKAGWSLREATEDAIAMFLDSDFCSITGIDHRLSGQVVSALLNKNCQLLLDERYLGSLSAAEFSEQAGCVQKFKHNDSTDLEKLLKESKGKYNTTIVIVNGLDSVEGDVPPLSELQRLKYEHGFALISDQTHSFLAIGETGRGCAEYWNEKYPDQIIGDVIDLHVGILSKTTESTVNFICGAAALEGPLRRRIEALGQLSIQNDSFETMSSTLLQVLWTLLQPTWLARKLRQWKATCRCLRDELSKFGIFVYGESDAPLLPVFTGPPSLSNDLSQALSRHGVLATPIMTPHVPYWESRVCVRLPPALGEEEARQFLGTVISAACEVGLCHRFEAMSQQIYTSDKRNRYSDVRISEAAETKNAYRLIHDLISQEPVAEPYGVPDNNIAGSIDFDSG